MIPQSVAAAQVDQNPAIAAIKQSLQQLEAIRVEKERVMREGVAMQDNLQAVEELMRVNQGAANKGEVFESYRAKYVEHFAQNEAFEQQKQQLAMAIQQQAPQMMQLVNSVGNDPAKNQFFEKINEAIIVQDQLSVLLEQGTQFYMKLNDILIRLQQSINDYKFSRDLQKNDLLQSI